MTHFQSQLRLGTGLVLALYVTQHLINHSFGMVSIDAAEAYRKTVGAAFQSLPGLILVYASLLTHIVIALTSLYRRSSLRMPFWQALQLILGLAIPTLLLGHAIGNRGYALLGDVDPNYYYVIASLKLSTASLVLTLLLIAVVWVHLMIGLHFWLRLRDRYRRYLPVSYAFAILLPALTYFGVYHMLEEAERWIRDTDRLDQIYAANLAMDRSDLDLLRFIDNWSWLAFVGIVGLVLSARQVRLWRQARRSRISIDHADHGEVSGLRGLTILECLRVARIPHASVCGGRGRCTTCRVRVRSSLGDLPPPNDLEARALARIDAPKDVRLACQLKPDDRIAITPLVMANQTLASTLHSGGVQGHEEYVVAMFVDMRGSTNLGERVLAYDVVFILNRFFTELSNALAATHGHYAQFAGDGLMALYGLDANRKQFACRDALAGAADMFQRIDKLNQQLALEFNEQIQMGIGIHGGDAIVGTMGPPRTPLLTAVGDNINIAARLESQTKTLGCDLLVSTETLAREAIAYDDANTESVELRGRLGQVQVCRFLRDQLPDPNASNPAP